MKHLKGLGREALALFKMFHVKHYKGDIKMITRNGVCYDLKQSPFKHKINNIVFVFSSQMHLDKFKKRLKENKEIINYSLSKRFNLDVDVEELANIVLYKKIETRGFLIEIEGNEVCQKEIRYAGGNLIQTNSKE